MPVVKSKSRFDVLLFNFSIRRDALTNKKKPKKQHPQTGYGLVFFVFLLQVCIISNMRTDTAVTSAETYKSGFWTQGKNVYNTYIGPIGPVRQRGELVVCMSASQFKFSGFGSHLRPLCVGFACSFCACVDFLFVRWLPLALQKPASHPSFSCL